MSTHRWTLWGAQKIRLPRRSEGIAPPCRRNGPSWSSFAPTPTSRAGSCAADSSTSPPVRRRCSSRSTSSSAACATRWRRARRPARMATRRTTARTAPKMTTAACQLAGWRAVVRAAAFRSANRACAAEAPPPRPRGPGGPQCANAPRRNSTGAHARAPPRSRAAAYRLFHRCARRPLIAAAHQQIICRSTVRQVQALAGDLRLRQTLVEATQRRGAVALHRVRCRQHAEVRGVHERGTGRFDRSHSLAQHRDADRRMALHHHRPAAIDRRDPQHVREAVLLGERRALRRERLGRGKSPSICRVTPAP